MAGGRLVGARPRAGPSQAFGSDSILIFGSAWERGRRREESVSRAGRGRALPRLGPKKAGQTSAAWRLTLQVRKRFVDTDRDFQVWRRTKNGPGAGSKSG